MKTYVSEFKVEWAHCDAAGIVFYPHYYIWFDQATERLFTANRLSYAEMQRDFGLAGTPLVETGASYKAPCPLAARLKLETWVDEWGGRSFLVRHRIAHADGTLAVEGFERRVWAAAAPDAPTGMRAAEIPDEVKARFVE